MLSRFIQVDKMKEHKTYSEMIKLPTYAERIEYLKIGGKVGADTFGVNRYLNQKFYNTQEWKNFRRMIILRDNGCDLGVKSMPIPEGMKMYIHHIEPISPIDLERKNIDILLNPDNAITVCFDTHQAIHYGDISIGNREPVERKPGDTKLW